DLSLCPPPAKAGGARTAGRCSGLLLRRQAQVLEVEAEVGPRRYRLHPRLHHLAVLVEREREERIRVEAPVAPSHDEGVVLPVLQVAEQLRGLRKLDLQALAAAADDDVAVPRVAVGPGV